MLIKKTNDVTHASIKMLVYGESGAGKTYLASTINEPILIISAEAGLLSLKDFKIDSVDLSIDDNDMLIPKEKRIERLVAVYKYLLLPETIKKYRWIYLDSLTEISQNLIESLYLEFPERSQTLAMYGENSKKLISIIKSFRDINHYNVVMTALSSLDKDDIGGRHMLPSVVGKVSEKLASYFDEVFYLYIQKDEKGNLSRKLLCNKTDRIIAKDRSGSLNVIEEPNLQKITDKIRGKKC